MANSKYSILVQAQIDKAQLQQQLNKVSASKAVKIKAQVQIDPKDIDRQIKLWENALAKMQARTPAAYAKEDVQKQVAVLNQMIEGFKGGAVPIKDVRVQLDNVRTSLVQTSSAMQAVNKDGMGMVQMFSLAANKVLVWLGATTLVYSSLKAISQMTNNVKELDSSLVELQKVTDLTGASLRAFTADAFKMGKEVGRTGKEAIDATTEFARAGYTIKESLDLGKVALVMTNVAEGISEVDEATSALIAVLRGYDLEANEAIRVTDIMNQVSNTTATNFDDLAEGLRRTSATLAQTGTSVEELTGLLVGGFEPLRNMEMVASGLIMISQRLRGIEEDGTAIEGLMPKLQKEFKEIANIDIVDPETGGLRSTYEILQDMSEVWPTLTDTQRQYLGELAAGNRQVKVLNSILTNWENVDKAIREATNSTGNAMRENEKFLDSIEGRINKLETAWLKLSEHTISGDFIKSTVDLGTALLELVDKVGLINVAFVALSALLGVKLPAVSALASTAIKALAASMGIAVGTVTTLQLAITGGLIGIAIVGAIAAFNALNTTIVETYNNFEKLKSQTVSNVGELTDLAKEYESLANKQDRSTEETRRLLDIQTILNNKYGALKEKVTAYTDAINGNTEAIKENIEWMKKQAQVEIEKFLEENKADYEKATRLLSGESKTSLGRGPNASKSLDEQITILSERIEKEGDVFGLLQSQLDNLLEQQEAARNLVTEYELQQNLLKEISYIEPPPDFASLGLDLVKNLEDSGEAVKDLEGLFDELSDIVDDNLGQAIEDYKDKQDELINKAAELKARIAEASSYEPTTTEGIQKQEEELWKLQQELENTNEAFARNAAEHDRATKMIIFNMMLQRISQMDLTNMKAEEANKVRGAAYQMAYDWAASAGLISESSLRAFGIVGSAIDHLTNNNIPAAIGAMASLGAWANSIAGDYYIRFLIVTEKISTTGYNDVGMGTKVREVQEGMKQEGVPDFDVPSGGFYPGGFDSGGGGGGAAKEKKEEEEKFTKTASELHNLIMRFIREQKDAEKELLKEQIDGFEEQLDGYKKVIDARKELIDTQKEELEYQEEIAEKNASLSKLQAEMAILEFDDSLESQARRLELSDEIADVEEDLKKTQRDHSYDMQKEALDKEYDAYEENINKEIELIQKQIDAIDAYLEESGTIAQDAMAIMEEKSEVFYQQLLEWNKVYGSGIDEEVTGAWEDAAAALEHYGNIADAILGDSGSGGDSDGGGSSDGRLNWKRQYGIKEGTAEWDEAVELGREEWKKRNPDAKKVVYHTGLEAGPVGGMKTPLNEMTAKLLKGELVLNQNDMLGIIRKYAMVGSNIRSVDNSGGGSLHIENLIRVDGNVTKDVIPDIERIAKQVMDNLSRTLVKRGFVREAKLFSI